MKEFTKTTIIKIVSAFKKSLFWIMLVLDIFLVILTMNRGWYFILFFIFFCLQIVIYEKLESVRKKARVKTFLPDKPEKDGIRYLRGKRAIEYSDAWEATNTLLENGNFSKAMLDIRLFFVKLTGLPKDYFTERHKYEPVSKRALDLFALTNFELRTKHMPDAYYSRWRRIFYKYLKFRYRKEEKRFEYWIRITSHRKRGVYVWHEDIDKYNKQHDIHKMTEDEQNEREQMLIGL